jgi:membrane dipeptidase
MLIDGHNDLAWAMRQLHNYDFNALDLSQYAPAFHTDISRLRKGGVTGQFWSVYAPSTLSGKEAAVVTVEQIMFIRAFIERFPNDLAFATTADDILNADQQGRIASLIGVEGGHCIDESLTILEMFYALGARYMTLTHNHNTSWADSATDQRNLGGLSTFGREVIHAMNRMGMLVDLSHVSTEVMTDALSITTAPAIFSHSCARALVDIPRNVPDNVLSLLTKNGGICMVAFVSDFVSNDFAQWFADKDKKDQTTPPIVTIDHVADHIDHIREVAGIEHVGIGADFDGAPDMPPALNDASTYPLLMNTLTNRGWSSPDLEKLRSGNILRVLRAAEDVAEKKQD